MFYTIWVGGVEVNSHLVSREEAYRIASNWRNDGYTDVIVERGTSPMSTILKLWRIWVKALGEKSGASNREADYIAIVRSVIVGLNFITCLFIIAGVIHNW